MISQTVGNIIAGQSSVLTVSFTVDANAPSSITNYAEISADDGDDCDSTPDDTNGNGTGETTGLIDDDIGTGCNTGGDEDDHDPETITIGNPDPSIKIDKLDANPNDQDNNV